MKRPWPLPSATVVNATTDAIAVDQQNSDGSVTTRKVSPAQLLSGGSGFLVGANNLSDVANAGQALINLGGAPKASPSLTGVPIAPTAAANTNTTQIATTAYVQTAISGLSGGSGGVSSVAGNTGIVTLAELLTAGLAPILDACRTVSSGPITLTTNDTVVYVSVSAPVTATLPASPGTGKTITLKDLNNAASNNITVNVASNGTIDSNATFIMNQSKQAVTFQYNGAGWSIL